MARRNSQEYLRGRRKLDRDQVMPKRGLARAYIDRERRGQDQEEFLREAEPREEKLTERYARRKKGRGERK